MCSVNIMRPLIKKRCQYFTTNFECHMDAWIPKGFPPKPYNQLMGMIVNCSPHFK